jgi:hypothetical protein
VSLLFLNKLHTITIVMLIYLIFPLQKAGAMDTESETIEEQSHSSLVALNKQLRLELIHQKNDNFDLRSRISELRLHISSCMRDVATSDSQAR